MIFQLIRPTTIKSGFFTSLPMRFLRNLQRLLFGFLSFAQGRNLPEYL